MSDHELLLGYSDEVEMPRRPYERMKSANDVLKSRQTERRARMLNVHKAASSPILRNFTTPSNPNRTSSIRMFQTSVKLIQGEIVKQQVFSTDLTVVYVSLSRLICKV